MKLRIRQLVPPLLLAALVACSGGEQPPAAEVALYQGRGMVRQMPAEQAASPEIWIRHEAFPDFVDIEGATVGMDSMTMPFRLAPGVDLAGLEAGEKVAFELTVDWAAGVPITVTAIEELAPGVELDF